MAPTNELARYRRKRERKKAAKRFVLILAVCAAVLSLFFFVEYLQQTDVLENWIDDLTNPSVSFPVKLSGGTPLGIRQVGSSVAVLTDTNLSLYRSSGRQTLNLQHQYANPAVSVAGEYFALYDQGGKTVTVYRGDKQVYQRDFEYAITTVRVADNGMIAVVTGSLRHLSEITVYSASSQNPVFQWRSAELHITGVLFQPDHSGITAICLGSNGGSLSTHFYFFAFGKDEQLAHAELEDMLVVSAGWKSGGVFAVGDHQCAMISPEGKVLRVTSYNGRTLLAFANDQNFGAVLALEDYTHAGAVSLLIFDENGSPSAQIDDVASFSTVQLSQNREILVLSKEDISVYSYDGSLLTTFEAPDGSQNLLMIGGDLFILELDQLDQRLFSYTPSNSSSSPPASQILDFSTSSMQTSSRPISSNSHESSESSENSESSQSAAPPSSMAPQTFESSLVFE